MVSYFLHGSSSNFCCFFDKFLIMYSFIATLGQRKGILPYLAHSLELILPDTEHLDYVYNQVHSFDPWNGFKDDIHHWFIFLGIN